MQKFIRIALPCVCFAVIIWWCCFNGFKYINWKWLIVAAGIGGFSITALYVKQHKMLGKRDAQRKNKWKRLLRLLRPNWKSKGQLAEERTGKTQNGKRIS